MIFCADLIAEKHGAACSDCQAALNWEILQLGFERDFLEQQIGLVYWEKDSMERDKNATQGNLQWVGL